MRVAFDLSPYANRKAGLGRYSAELGRALTELGQPELFVFAAAPRGASLPSWATGRPSRRVEVGMRRWRLQVLLAHLAGWGYDAYLDGADLFHATEHLLLPLRRTPSILTVHDLIFRLFPQYHLPLNRLFLGLAMPLFVRRASHILTVSEASRADLLRCYRVPPEKVTVVPEGVSPHYRPVPDGLERRAVLERYGIRAPYVLTVGVIEPRKNLPTLLAAFDELRRQGLRHQLVVVGPRGWLDEPIVRQAQARTPHVHLTGYVAEADLPAVYSGAEVLAYPSLYEGVGLPALEAMACGTPVVASNASALPEVVGDAGLLVSPMDIEAWVEALGRVLEDGDLRRELGENGRARAAGYTWEAAALATAAVYEKALNARGGL